MKRTRMSPTRGIHLLLAALLLTLLRPAITCADESEDKAALVALFVRGVTWPSGALAKAKGQPTVAVLGEDELAIALVSALSTESIGGKPVFVKFVRRPSDVAGAQVVFVASSAYAQWDEVLTALAGTAALTLADSPGFTGKGGMVTFQRTSGKLGLSVNKAKLDAAGFKLGSKAIALVN